MMEINKKLTPKRAQELQSALQEKVKKIGQCQVQIMNYENLIKKHYEELKQIQKELWGCE